MITSVEVSVALFRYPDSSNLRYFERCVAVLRPALGDTCAIVMLATSNICSVSRNSYWLSACMSAHSVAILVGKICSGLSSAVSIN